MEDLFWSDTPMLQTQVNPLVTSHPIRSLVHLSVDQARFTAALDSAMPAAVAYPVLLLLLFNLFSSFLLTGACPVSLIHPTPYIPWFVLLDQGRFTAALDSAMPAAVAYLATFSQYDAYIRFDEEAFAARYVGLGPTRFTHIYIYIHLYIDACKPMHAYVCVLPAGHILGMHVRGTDKTVQDIDVYKYNHILIYIFVCIYLSC